MRWIAVSVCSAGLLACGQSAFPQSPNTSSGVMVTTGAPVKAPKTPLKSAAPAPPKPADSTAQLPSDFDGWIAADAPTSVTDPALADAASAAALKEYGFTAAQLGKYKRGSETLSIHLLRFHDVSGSYGAYSFYRQNGWPKEDIGEGATSSKNRVLFWKGTALVDATYSHIGPMSASEMRDLAAQLPTAQGTAALAPPILSNLPQTSLDKQTTHYALGPAGYSGAGGVLPAEIVGFDRGAETATANYSLRSNPATLTIINYPTPQMAAAQLTRIQAYIKAGANAQPPRPKPLTDSDQASIEVRRSGPLVALVSGDAIPEESHKLLAEVHFEADLTSMPQSGESEVAKTGKLLLGIATLVVIGCTAAILLGLFLGGGRALYRMARGKPISSVYEAEFIRLNLER